MCAYSVNVTMFIVSRLLIGCFVNIIMIPGYTLTVEIVGAKYRSWAVMFSCGAFAAGVIILSYPFAYFFNDWRDLQLYGGLLGVLSSISGYLIPESYKWYIAKGDKSSATEIALYVMKRNRSKAFSKDLAVINTSDKELLAESIQQLILEGQKESEKSNLSLIDLFKNKFIGYVSDN